MSMTPRLMPSPEAMLSHILPLSALSEQKLPPGTQAKNGDEYLVMHDGGRTNHGDQTPSNGGPERFLREECTADGSRGKKPEKDRGRSNRDRENQVKRENFHEI